MILFVTLCITLVWYHFGTLDNPRLETLGEGTFFIHSRELVHSPLITSTIPAGIGFIYQMPSKHVNTVRSLFNNIDGESITLDTPKSSDQILRMLGYTMVQAQGTYETIRVVYAYSSRGRNFLTIDGTRINLQIATRGDRVTIGWPVILGSF